MSSCTTKVCPSCLVRKLSSAFIGDSGKKLVRCKICTTKRKLMGAKSKVDRDKYDAPLMKKGKCHGVPGVKKCDVETSNYRCDDCWAIIRGIKMESSTNYTGAEYGTGGTG